MTNFADCTVCKERYDLQNHHECPGTAEDRIFSLECRADEQQEEIDKLKKEIQELREEIDSLRRRARNI